MESVMALRRAYVLCFAPGRCSIEIDQIEVVAIGMRMQPLLAFAPSRRVGLL